MSKKDTSVAMYTDNRIMDKIELLLLKLTIFTFFVGQISFTGDQ